MWEINPGIPDRGNNSEEVGNHSRARVVARRDESKEGISRNNCA